MHTNIKYITGSGKLSFFRITYILLISVIFIFTFSVNVFATPPSSPIQIRDISLDKTTYNTNEEIKVNLRMFCMCENKIDNVGIYAFIDKEPHFNFYQESPAKLISLNNGEDNWAELILQPQKEGRHPLQISAIKLGNVGAYSGYAGDTKYLSIDVIGQRNFLINIFVDIKNFFYKLFQTAR